jgi:hypothetical protein
MCISKGNAISVPFQVRNHLGSQTRLSGALWALWVVFIKKMSRQRKCSATLKFRGSMEAKFRKVHCRKTKLSCKLIFRGIPHACPGYSRCWRIHKVTRTPAKFLSGYKSTFCWLVCCWESFWVSQCGRLESRQCRNCNQSCPWRILSCPIPWCRLSGS